MVLISMLCACKKEKTSDRLSIREAMPSFAKFEFAEEKEKGYKLITSEIESLYTFDSIILMLIPSDEEFQEDWIYKITFEPKEIAPNGNEIMILFGEHSVSINGKNYVAKDGVNYSDILNWAKWKYEYFDYELITDDAFIKPAL